MVPKFSELLHAEAELENLEPLIEVHSEEEDVADVRHLQRRPKPGLEVCRRRNLPSISGIVAFGLLVVFLLHLRRPSHPDDLLILQGSEITHLTPQFFPAHKSERVQIKYGPFRVPGSGQDNGMKSIKMRDVKMPCRECSIVWMQAGLEFWDGRYAGPKERLWLHHTVLRNEGREAAKSCKMGGTERFFASGNERTVVNLGSNGTEKVGYWLDEKDTVSMATELMNSHEEPQIAVLTVTYEYIPYKAHDFVNTRPIWIDIGGCHSDVPIPTGQTSFEVESSIWLSRINGRVVTVVSHLHDGGVHLRLRKNGDDVCESKAEYEMVSEFENHSPGMDMNHITAMPACFGVGKMAVGEEWSVKVHYDLEKHQPMLEHNGKAAPVMGIAIAYVVEN